MKKSKKTSKLKQRVQKLKTDIPAVFIAMKHPKTPIIPKFLAVIAIGYALSPIDLIPDFIPVIGLLDDVIIVPALIAVIVKLIPAEVFAECREKSEGLWVDGKPKKWYYALPIVVVWLLLVLLIVKIIL